MIGLLVAGVGLLLCLAAMLAFRSVGRVVGVTNDQLVESGPYRLSRNPQGLGFGLFWLGYAVLQPSPWSATGFVVYALMMHAMVRLEEQHLRRRFGEPCSSYLARTPRYLGLPRRGAESENTSGWR